LREKNWIRIQNAKEMGGGLKISKKQHKRGVEKRERGRTIPWKRLLIRRERKRKKHLTCADGKETKKRRAKISGN